MANFKYLDENGVLVIAGKIKDVNAELSILKTTVQENAEADAELAEKVEGISGSLETLATKEELNAAKAELQGNIDIVQGEYEQHLSDAATALDNKVSWELGKTTIVLPNHGQIVGEGNDGEQEGKADYDGNASLVMLSKWNVADFGSKKYPINLNGKEAHPKYNDKEELAFVSELPSVGAFFDEVSYNEESREIEFKQGETVLKTLDATAFIKDGMVSGAEVKDGKLVITFNTDAGQEAIEISISEIFNAENYYTKDEVDETLENYVYYTPFGNNRKTIVLAEGDTISSMGINLGMVKTYENLYYETGNAESGLMPVLEVGGTKGALVLNTCEDRVKVEVVEEGKRIQHSIATLEDLPVLVALTEDEINAMFK